MFLGAQRGRESVVEVDFATTCVRASAEQDAWHGTLRRPGMFGAWSVDWRVACLILFSELFFFFEG